MYIIVVEQSGKQPSSKLGLYFRKACSPMETPERLLPPYPDSKLITGYLALSSRYDYYFAIQTCLRLLLRTESPDSPPHACKPVFFYYDHPLSHLSYCIFSHFNPLFLPSCQFPSDGLLRVPQLSPEALHLSDTLVHFLRGVLLHAMARVVKQSERPSVISAQTQRVALDGFLCARHGPYKECWPA